MKIIKTSIGIIVIVALLAWGGVTLKNNKAKSEEETSIVAKGVDSISVNVEKVTLKVLNTDYLANGTFEPIQELKFPSEVSGKVLKVLVNEGDFVREGQTLAIIRSDQQSIDLNTAEAVYQNALTENQRFERALESGGVTQQQVESTRLALKNAKAQLEQAKIRVGDLHIKASIAGVVNQRLIEPGSYVSPGTQLFEIVNVSNLKLRVNVDENQVVNYKVGDEIKVKASVYPDKEFKGKITFIAPKATSSLSFPMDIQVNNTASNDLRAGMYGTAIFSSAEDDSKTTAILVVPRSAFVGGLNMGEVFVIKEGKSYLTKISIGRNFGEWVEVLGGVQENEIVATSGQINLTDGAKIKIIK